MRNMLSYDAVESLELGASQTTGLEQEDFQTRHSPLAMLMSDSRTNGLMEQLTVHLEALRKAAERGVKPPVLRISKDVILASRQTWEKAVIEGESHLYDLANLVTRLLTGAKNLQFVARVVMGRGEEVEAPGQRRIVIEEQIAPDTMKRLTDYTLSQRIARRYQYRANADDAFQALYPRASFLSFWPLDPRDGTPVSRVLTRVKSNDQIWNKVCDALFAVDKLVARDKILNSKSQYIKDVFGVKILVMKQADIYVVEQLLAQHKWHGNSLRALGLDPKDMTLRKLELLERKDYVNGPKEQKKQTGWEALKNVYRWGNHIFEFQMQTEANHYLETIDLTDTSHRTFEMQRRKVRRELERMVPHYAEYRRLLKLIFREEKDEALLEFEKKVPWLVIE